MFLFDTLKRNLFQNHKASCASDEGSAPAGDAGTKKFSLRKLKKKVKEPEVCKSVTDNCGKTGAGVTGAGAGIAGGGTGDTNVGGEELRPTGNVTKVTIKEKCDNTYKEPRLHSHQRPGEDLPLGYIHPGLMRHIHNGARNRLPNCFEGAYVNVKQSPMRNWVIGHSLSLSSVSPGGYKLMTSYIDRGSAGHLPYFVMEAAPGGQISCEARMPVARGTKIAAFAQIANAELYNFETILDTCFDSFTASLIAVNREFMALHFLQAMTNELALGAEVVLRSKESEASSISGAARYMNNSNFVSGTFGNRGVDICFARAINPMLTVAAMLEVGFSVQKAVATLGYEWHTEDWTVKSSIDSDGLVGATLNKSFDARHAVLGCAFSALLNHPNDKFRMGFGITATLK